MEIDYQKIMIEDKSEIESTTVWSFPIRGNWSSHSSRFRGNWAPQVVRNLILMYTSPGDLVLDPFLGSGTSLIEGKLLSRRGIGVDINPNFIKLAKSHIERAEGPEMRQSVVLADARSLGFLQPQIVDLALLHPPYANSIVYSDIEGDLSRIYSVEQFCYELRTALREVIRIVRAGGFIAIMIGDLRRSRKVIPLGFKVMQMCLSCGLDLREIVIKIQHNCQSTDKWTAIARRMGFLLLMHEYILVFNRP